MKAVVNGKIVTETGVIENGVILFDEKIGAIGENLRLGSAEIIDARGEYILPGLVDIHIHGFGGCDVSDGEADGLRKISEALPKYGVTAWCPTTMTVALDEIQKAVDTVWELHGKNVGAEILGANVEGPFISAKKKGAQDAKHILPPDFDFVVKNKDKIRLITVAPEVDGAVEFVKKVVGLNRIAVSVGHADADGAVTRRAFDCGARHTTHLFNAMTPLGHREIGVVGAALTDERVSCELIADNFHVNHELFGMLNRLKGDKLVLITDCMRAGGMSDGEYTLGGQKVIVRGIECRTEDGTIAGSILTLNKAVRNYMKGAKLTICEAVRAASLNPARVIGEDNVRGSLAVGKNADIVIADGEINIKKTFVRGREAWSETL